MEPVANLFDKLDKQIKDTKKMVSDIRKKWYEALDKQHESDLLQEKILHKLDKVSKVQGEVANLIDAITNAFDTHTVDDVEGESADMMI